MFLRRDGADSACDWGRGHGEFLGEGGTSWWGLKAAFARWAGEAKVEVRSHARPVFSCFGFGRWWLVMFFARNRRRVVFDRDP